MNRKHKKSWIPKQIKNLFNRNQQIHSMIDDDSEEIRKQYMKIVKTPEVKVQQKTDQQDRDSIYQKPPDKLHSNNTYLLQKLQQQENEIAQLQKIIAQLQQILQDNGEFKEDVNFQLAQTKININMIYDNQVSLKDQLDQQQTLLQNIEQMIIADKLNDSNIQMQTVIQPQSDTAINPPEQEIQQLQNTVIQQQDVKKIQEPQQNTIQVQDIQQQPQSNSQHEEPIPQDTQQQNINPTIPAQPQKQVQFGFQNFKPAQQQPFTNNEMQHNSQQPVPQQQSNQTNIQQQPPKPSVPQQNINMGFSNIPQKALNQANKLGFQQKKQVQIKFDDNFLEPSKKAGKQK